MPALDCGCRDEHRCEDDYDPADRTMILDGFGMLKRLEYRDELFLRR
ncbi:hypothetical protein [Rhodococcus sp. 1163]|nr:hypothetical protein [Rhodococcus sp. 1163]